MRSPAAIAAVLLTAALAPAADLEDAVTHHQVRANGQILRYTACAGLLPIRNNDAGDIHAHIFFVAYTLDLAAGQPARPVTFIWNGGPGANSTLVHLSGFGPRRLKSADDPLSPRRRPPRSKTTTPRGSNSPTWCSSIRLAPASAVP
jgi:carboxypeptidase C (cathepsin A)